MAGGAPGDASDAILRDHTSWPPPGASTSIGGVSSAAGASNGALSVRDDGGADFDLYERLRCFGRPRDFHDPLTDANDQVQPTCPPSALSPLYVDEVYCGAGCSLAYLIKPVLRAAAERRQLMAESSRYAMGERCALPTERRRLACFFQPLTASTVAMPRHAQGSANSAGIEAPISQRTYSAALGAYQSSTSLVSALTQDLPGWLAPRDPATVVNAADARWFRLTGRVLSFITAPNARLRGLVDALATQLGIDEAAHRPLLGLHVRQGDACTDKEAKAKARAECVPLSAYMPHVERLVRDHGYKAIYLSTDASEVVDEARRRWPHLTWLVQPLDRGRYAFFNRSGLTIEKLLWSGLYARQRQQLGLSPSLEFDEFMSDLYLLARSDGFVGSFTGNLDRLVYALMSAYATPMGAPAVAMKPFVSLSAYWCNEHGVERAGRAVTGARFDC